MINEKGRGEGKERGGEREERERGERGEGEGRERGG